MKRHIMWFLLLFSCFLYGCRSLSAQKTDKSYRVVTPTTYEKVLDLVFERDAQSNDNNVLLRFEPNDAPESQLLIKVNATDTQVIRYISRSGNIYQKLNAIVKNSGREDVLEMAKQIKVDKRLLHVPQADANKWWSNLPSATANSIKLSEERSAKAANGIGTITLDGTSYGFWYDQAGIHWQFSAIDYEVRSREVTGQVDLVRWMNMVRLDVARQEQGEQSGKL